MFECGRTTKSSGVHDLAPHQDKVFDVPEAPNGLPDNFFETAAFFDTGMQREAKKLNNTFFYIESFALTKHFYKYLLPFQIRRDCPIRQV